VNKAVVAVPDDKRISIYYAEGVEGLQTDPEQSQHALTFKLAGANNVAQVEVQSFGMSSVDMERVRAWDPEVIFAWGAAHGGADELIRESPSWADIRAVRDGRVYTVPAAPFNWVDRPPGVNRLLGVQWVANILYPDYYDVDMVAETKEFYEKMYRASITDEQAIELLGNSYPPRGA
jgi:iron complex transport system substrate-binding protein